MKIGGFSSTKKLKMRFLLIAVTCLLLSGVSALNRKPKLRPRPRSLSGYRRATSQHRGSDGQPLYWYCRRGSRLAICHRRGHAAKASMAPGALMARGQHTLPKTYSGSDTDECRSEDHLCQHRCINTVESYRCTCNRGYRLQADGRTCKPDHYARGHSLKSNKIFQKVAKKSGSKENEVDIVKGKTSFPGRRPISYYYAELLRKLAVPQLHRLKASSKASCQSIRCQYRCALKDNHPECLCPTSMKLAPNKRSCIDRNECLESEEPVCPSGQECSNTYGSFSCKCPSGQEFTYTLHGKICHDVNECFTGDHKCGPNARCINTAGSYTCECLPGYQGDGAVCEASVVRDPMSLSSRLLAARGMRRYGYSRLGRLRSRTHFANLN